MIQIRIVQDLVTEPVTLQEAKDWLSIDFSDFDSMLNILIVAAREQSEKVSGQAYGEKVFEVTGNEKDHKVYPIQPFVEDTEWADEDGVIKYRYKAGFTILPYDLRLSILQRIATGFAYRQNGVSEAVNATINQSHNAELKYSYLYI